uniref:C3H1-type domain-containing protein n=1 Tax=Rhizophora mucronata TaxID=61149 RepID=A0A2P2MAY3_RHIMU
MADDMVTPLDSQHKPLSVFDRVRISAKKILGFEEKQLKCGGNMEHSESPNSVANPNPSDGDRTAEDGHLHDKLNEQLDLKEDEKGEKRWIVYAQSVQDQTAVEHEKELHEEQHQQLDLNERFNGTTTHQYPLRPDAEDCAYYMKTGTCKFGSNCKYNHPLRRNNQEKVKEREEAVEVPGQEECKYYLRTGGCKYGNSCRFNHPQAKTAVSPVLELNFLGLPIRPGEKECPYYMRNGSCKYEANCIFHHPDPTDVGGSDPQAFFNGGSTSVMIPSQSCINSRSSPRALNETAPFLQLMFPPTQGIPSNNTEWNGYQAPIYQPERIHPPPAYFIGNLTSETNDFACQRYQTLVNEFPERPGQPECSFYMKTGDCKFKSNCKFHHPKNRLSKSPPCALSDKGLPLRPVFGSFHIIL